MLLCVGIILLLAILALVQSWNLNSLSIALLALAIVLAVTQNWPVAVHLVRLLGIVIVVGPALFAAGLGMQLVAAVLESQVSRWLESFSIAITGFHTFSVLVGVSMIRYARLAPVPSQRSVTTTEADR